MSLRPERVIAWTKAEFVFDREGFEEALKLLFETCRHVSTLYIGDTVYETVRLRSGETLVAKVRPVVIAYEFGVSNRPGPVRRMFWTQPDHGAGVVAVVPPGYESIANVLAKEFIEGE